MSHGVGEQLDRINQWYAAHGYTDIRATSDSVPVGRDWNIVFRVATSVGSDGMARMLAEDVAESHALACGKTDGGKIAFEYLVPCTGEPDKSQLPEIDLKLHGAVYDLGNRMKRLLDLAAGRLPATERTTGDTRLGPS